MGWVVAQGAREQGHHDGALGAAQYAQGVVPGLAGKETVGMGPRGECPTGLHGVRLLLSASLKERFLPRTEGHRGWVPGSHPPRRHCEQTVRPYRFPFPSLGSATPPREAFAEVPQAQEEPATRSLDGPFLQHTLPMHGLQFQKRFYLEGGVGQDGFPNPSPPSPGTPHPAL